MGKKHNGPRVLILDIETSPILAWVWDIWDQNVALNQIKQDWQVLSFAAKWLGDSKVIQHDQRKNKVLNDKSILKTAHKLLDEADIVITQNGKKFDIKKLNARFIQRGMLPPSGFKQIDTYEVARSKFAFTSNKLEYLTDKINKKYKKLKNSGFTLWLRCMDGDISAWNEMAKYNKYDVLATEELYLKVQGWSNAINFNVYTNDEDLGCNCGSTSFKRNGFAYTASGKFQRYQCNECGKETRSKDNMLTKEKRKSLRARVT